jgi:hypothetical protein
MGHSIGNYMTFDFDSPEWPAKANVMIINGGEVNVGKEIRFEAAKGTTLPKFVKKRLQEGTEQLIVCFGLAKDVLEVSGLVAENNAKLKRKKTPVKLLYIVHDDFESVWSPAGNANIRLIPGRLPRFFHQGTWWNIEPREYYAQRGLPSEVNTPDGFTYEDIAFAANIDYLKLHDQVPLAATFIEEVFKKSKEMNYQFHEHIILSIARLVKAMEPNLRARKKEYMDIAQRITTALADVLPTQPALSQKYSPLVRELQAFLRTPPRPVPGPAPERAPAPQGTLGIDLAKLFATAVMFPGASWEPLAMASLFRCKDRPEVFYQFVNSLGGQWLRFEDGKIRVAQEYAPFTKTELAAELARRLDAFMKDLVKRM